MKFHDSGKKRESEFVNRSIESQITKDILNRVCLHCGRRYGEHTGNYENSVCPEHFKYVI